MFYTVSPNLDGITFATRYCKDKGGMQVISLKYTTYKECLLKIIEHYSKVLDKDKQLRNITDNLSENDLTNLINNDFKKFMEILTTLKGITYKNTDLRDNYFRKIGHVVREYDKKITNAKEVNNLIKFHALFVKSGFNFGKDAKDLFKLYLDFYNRFSKSELTSVEKNLILLDDDNRYLFPICKSKIELYHNELEKNTLDIFLNSFKDRDDALIFILNLEMFKPDIIKKYKDTIANIRKFNEFIMHHVNSDAEIKYHDNRKKIVLDILKEINDSNIKGSTALKFGII